MKTLFGLPEEVKFCTRCVMSNQRPCSTVEVLHTTGQEHAMIHFDDEGVCDACRVVEDKERTDWATRDAELRTLCDRHRRHDGRYDCIVPGSGGKDSFYAALVLRDEYDMHPLTVTWAPHLHTDWGRRNFDAWVDSGLDNVLFTPDGRVRHLLTRLALENLFHPFQPFIIGQKNLGPKAALLYDVPLVFYGEDEAEHGNPRTGTATPYRDRKFDADPNLIMSLGGVEIGKLLSDYGLSKNDLLPYLPIDRHPGIEVHYLGYYRRWDALQSLRYAMEHGFRTAPERTAGTFTNWNSIDDKIDDLHYYTTFVKFGVGRATYDASLLIQSGEITRERGLEFVRMYDGEWPRRFLDELFRYLSIRPDEYPTASGMFEHQGMTTHHFQELADKFRSPHLWCGGSGARGWHLRHTVYVAES